MVRSYRKDSSHIWWPQRWIAVQVVTSTGSKELLSKKKKKVENIKLEKLTIGVSKRKKQKAR